MANSEEIQAVIMQVAIQAATVAVRAVREANQPTKSHTRKSIQEEQQKPRQARPMMSQPACNWKAPDRYVELLNFEMEIANMLQAKCMILIRSRRFPS